MIHYTCDGCHRPIDTEGELRYVVRLEVYAAFDACEEDQDTGHDHLQEIDDILETLDLDDAEFEEDVFQQVRYDLCGECRRRFLKNPLGKLTTRDLGFSNN